MNEDEEACTPRADEATPLREKPRRSRSLVLGACATLALGAAASSRKTTTSLFGWSATWGNDYQCRVGAGSSPKYTITTSSPGSSTRSSRCASSAPPTNHGRRRGRRRRHDEFEDPSTYWDCNGKVHIRKLAFGAVKPMELHFPWTSTTSRRTVGRQVLHALPKRLLMIILLQ